MKVRGLPWASILSVGWSMAAQAAEGPPKEPAKTEHSITLLAGYGAGERFDDDARNRYGLALGARAGLTFTPPLYVGLSFLHFSGYAVPEQKVHLSTLDAELGYELRLFQERALIRPQVALGIAQPATIQPDNAGYPLAFHWAPGVLVGVRFAPVLFTAEYRRDIVPSDWPSSNSALFGCGLML